MEHVRHKGHCKASLAILGQSETREAKYYWFSPSAHLSVNVIFPYYLDLHHGSGVRKRIGPYRRGTVKTLLCSIYIK